MKLQSAAGSLPAVLFAFSALLRRVCDIKNHVSSAHNLIRNSLPHRTGESCHMPEACNYDDIML